MTDASVQLRLCWPEAVAPRCGYRVAGRPLWSDVPIAELSAFALDSAPPGWSPMQVPGRACSRPIQQRGLVAGGWRRVSVVSGGDGLRLLIDGIGDFAVTTNGAVVAVLSKEAKASSEDFAAGLLGPPLILALAQQNVWCLHASAAAIDGRVIGFVGESGHGKSTLAHFLGVEAGGGWRRVADDVLPVALEPDGLAALPHFPQLKLPTDALYGIDEPLRLPLDALYVIAPQRGQCTLSERRLTPREAMQMLIRHTIAARLFDPRLLAKHMDFCAAAAGLVPVHILSYPHQRSILPELAALTGVLQSHTGP